MFLFYLSLSDYKRCIFLLKTVDWLKHSFRKKPIITTTLENTFHHRFPVTVPYHSNQQLHSQLLYLPSHLAIHRLHNVCPYLFHKLNDKFDSFNSRHRLAGCSDRRLASDWIHSTSKTYYCRISSLQREALVLTCTEQDGEAILLLSSSLECSKRKKGSMWTR